MIEKTLTGVGFFDQTYGGTYRGRAMLASGRAGSGKTVLGLQFIHQGAKQDERCLMLSSWPAQDLVIFAHSLGVPISNAIDSGNLIVLEYSNYVSSGTDGGDITLPPEGFVQLQDIIVSNAVQRVVLDTALPWVSVQPVEKLEEHIFSFVRAFERMAVTSLLTLPKPVSPMAFRLKNKLTDLVPVCVTLNKDRDAERYLWVVSKYLGEKRIGAEMEYQIVEGVGITAGTSRNSSASPAREEENLSAQKTAFSKIIWEDDAKTAPSARDQLESPAE